MIIYLFIIITSIIIPIISIASIIVTINITIIIFSAERHLLPRAAFSFGFFRCVLPRKSTAVALVQAVLFLSGGGASGSNGGGGGVSGSEQHYF